MFVRKNKNRSGSTSVQVITKRKRQNVVLKSIGSARSPEEVEILVIKARQYISNLQGAVELFTDKEDQLIETFVQGISTSDLRIVGPKIVLDKIFSSLSYDTIATDELFKHLVICRIVSPGSKLKTVNYLFRHYQISISEQSVYRYMDTIQEDVKPLVEQLTYKHTSKVLSGTVGIVFYDMTTLYFETESQDDLRKIGYSKDGKHQHPQIMIGLLVATNGYPIGYDIYKGNTAETSTLIPILEQMMEKFSLDKPIIVADAALLSKKNIEELISNEYEFILGGRIKNESKENQNLIHSKEITESEPIELSHNYGRTIISYSAKRAAKDLFNRKRGLKRIEQKVKKGKLTKASINNRGYNKYLKLEGETKVEVNYDKFKADAKWDGLKGYVTNTKLSPKEVIAHYSNLWQVERAFRMSKSDLRFRPIYHRKENRIKAHILICFASYAIYKELERLLRVKKIPLSVEKAVEELKQIQELSYSLPNSKKRKSQILSPTDNQKLLLDLL